MTQCWAEGHTEWDPSSGLATREVKNPLVPVKAQSSAGPPHRGHAIARLQLHDAAGVGQVRGPGWLPGACLCHSRGGAPSMPMSFPHDEPVTPTHLESARAVWGCPTLVPS